MKDHYTYEVERDNKKGEVKIVIQVDEAGYKHAADAAFEVLKGEVSISGFRAGKAPRDMIEKRLGMRLVQEAIDHLANELGVEVLEQEKLDPITKIEYSLEEPKDSKGIAFSFSFAIYPEIKLPDLKKIKVEKQSTEVTKEDIDNVVYRLFIEEYHKQFGTKEEEKDEKKVAAEKEEVIKWVTDKQVEDLSYEGMKTLDELRTHIEGQLKEIKEQDLDEKYRNDILAKVIDAADFQVPDKLVDHYAHHKADDYRQRVEQLNIELDVFLQAQSTSMEKLEENWKKEAKMKYSAELVLAEIAKEYELIPSKEEIQAEIDAIQDPKMRDDFDNLNGRRYVASVILQQKGMLKLIEIVESGNSKK